MKTLLQNVSVALRKLVVMTPIITATNQQLLHWW